MTETKKTSIAQKSSTTKFAVKSTAKKESSPKKTISTAKKTKDAVKPVEKKPVKTKKDSNAIYATGKRKNAVAKVWLSNGTGSVIINEKPANEYLKRAILGVIINQPFAKTETEGKFDIVCNVSGGGLSGQAGAIKHAISIALQLLNPELRGVLKSVGFLTRDSRIVERKKAGLKKARKGQVYQKR